MEGFNNFHDMPLFGMGVGDTEYVSSGQYDSFYRYTTSRALSKPHHVRVHSPSARLRATSTVSNTYLGRLLCWETQSCNESLLVVPHLVIIHTDHGIIARPVRRGRVAVVIVEGFHVQPVPAFLRIPTLHAKQGQAQNGERTLIRVSRYAFPRKK